jgi:hypothetical protein
MRSFAKLSPGMTAILARSDCALRVSWSLGPVDRRNPVTEPLASVNLEFAEHFFGATKSTLLNRRNEANFTEVKFALEATQDFIIDPSFITQANCGSALDP